MPNQTEADDISHALLEAKLIACAQSHAVTSQYWWQGKCDTAQEIILTLKTRPELFSAVKDRTQHIHSYDTPEIIALPILDASDDYLNWILDNTQKVESKKS